MERVNKLGKKKMLGDLFREEEAELRHLLGSKPNLVQLYELIFARPEKDRLEAEKAYAVHFVEMQLKNKLDP